MIERGADVISDHALDLFGTMLLMQQISTQGGGRNFRNMLMFGDRGDLSLGEAAKRNTIFQRNHFYQVK